MGKYCQLVIGPAGCGKSTYCRTIQQHLQDSKRIVHLVNLDPAADYFEYPPSIDIRDLISLEDVMEEMEYGPNGGLLYCFEYLLENFEWLEDQMGDFTDDYLIIDCPGQIELYTHIPIMKKICDLFQNQMSYRVVGVYCLDSQFVEDTAKFFSAVMSAISTMFLLGVPHINVLTKMDLVRPSSLKEIERYLQADPSLLTEISSSKMVGTYKALNEAIVSMIEEYSMVNFIPLNIKDEDSIEYVLSSADFTIQYGEDEEPKEPKEIEDPSGE